MKGSELRITAHNLDYRIVLKAIQQAGEAPLWQHERALGLLSVSVRTRGDAAGREPEIVRDTDPNAGIDAILPLERLVSGSVAWPREGEATSWYASMRLLRRAGVAAAVQRLDEWCRTRGLEARQDT